MYPEPINVAIVDDHTLFRSLLKSYISDENNLKVVIASPDIADLLGKLEQTKVDILVMDLFMPQRV
jgi:DNA-binding NarL/FixJ family response regulator